ncbi:hypothetical protein YDYSG_13880 [Paenibacillus tyrfis]|uniref:AraC family transcriptional regulator n=1 Tax=Paenibacillus tyrfis TaxID=1501230 RepID=UPI002492BAC8|nr:AraC family transcriptional regulator [Paenibacillus tyrfis]GLI05358.1 hypothetical protein YDYSG_13880 [Paenibacillus tyrfis]
MSNNEPDFSLLSHLLKDMKTELLNARWSKCNPDWIQKPFTPAYSKIYYICEGEGRMTVGGQELFPLPGQLVFAPAGLVQSFSVIDPAQTYTMYWCHFTSDLNWTGLFSLFKLPYCLTAQEPSEAIALFERLADEHNAKKGPARSIRIEAALLGVIACYLEQAVLRQKEQAGLSFRHSKLGEVLDYIDAHLAEEITIAELADIVHHHPNYFVRFFKRQLGTTPMTYIYERRLEKAKQLIGSTDMTIGEVAQATGFHDLFHLSKNFKKSVGIAPTEYRSLSRGLQLPSE